jgi:ArsR family transcriptional regulator
VQHRFAEARELYADVWLGFSEVELQLLLSKTGFGNLHTAVVHKEIEAPFFQTVLATGLKASV